MLHKIIRFGQPIMLLLIGITLLFWSFFSSIIPWLDLKQVIGVTIAIIASLIFYYDQFFCKIFINKSNFNHIDLTASIRLANDFVKNCKHIRIYALSTNMIQPIFKSMNIKADYCSILVYTPENRSDNSNVDIYQNNLSMLRSEWSNLKEDAFFKQVEIKGYDFTPTEFMILFDEKVVIIGHYIFNDNRFPMCDVQEPYVLTNDQLNNKILIEKYISLYESIYSSPYTSVTP